MAAEVLKEPLDVMWYPPTINRIMSSAFRGDR